MNRLLLGTSAWNAWRASIRDASSSSPDDQLPDFIAWDLSESDLSRIDLREALLVMCDFRAADLSEADLHDADLGAAVLAESNLTGSDLRGAILVRADLTRAHLYGADLSSADLTEATLEGAKFSVSTQWPRDFDPLKRGAVLVADGEEDTFTIQFDENLSASQVKCALTALADFYRTCGGIGLEITPEFEEVVILRPEPVYA